MLFCWNAQIVILPNKKEINKISWGNTLLPQKGQSYHLMSHMDGSWLFGLFSFYLENLSALLSLRFFDKTSI